MIVRLQLRFGRYRTGEIYAALVLLETPVQTMTPRAVAPFQKPLEDLLEHLPCSYIEAFEKAQTLFDPRHPSNCLYLVIAGSVASFQTTEFGAQILIDIHAVDDFFGESALLGCCHASGKAVALEDTKVMTWTDLQLESLMTARPKLGLALLQNLIARELTVLERLKCFSVHQIASRVACALIYFSEKLGSPAPDGS